MAHTTQQYNLSLRGPALSPHPSCVHSIPRPGMQSETPPLHVDNQAGKRTTTAWIKSKCHKDDCTANYTLVFSINTLNAN